jgi:rubrerythrin
MAKKSKSQGLLSIALGPDAKAPHARSIALGWNITTTREQEFAIRFPDGTVFRKTMNEETWKTLFNLLAKSEVAAAEDDLTEWKGAISGRLDKIEDFIRDIAEAEEDEEKMADGNVDEDEFLCPKCATALEDGKCNICGYPDSK